MHSFHSSTTRSAGDRLAVTKGDVFSIQCLDWAEGNFGLEDSPSLNALLPRSPVFSITFTSEYVTAFDLRLANLLLRKLTGSLSRSGHLVSVSAQIAISNSNREASRWLKRIHHIST
jgi:hypothetical protein